MISLASQNRETTKRIFAESSVNDVKIIKSFRFHEYVHLHAGRHFFLSISLQQQILFFIFSKLKIVLLMHQLKNIQRRFQQ